MGSNHRGNRSGPDRAGASIDLKLLYLLTHSMQPDGNFMILLRAVSAV